MHDRTFFKDRYSAFEPPIPPRDASLSAPGRDSPKRPSHEWPNRNGALIPPPQPPPQSRAQTQANAPLIYINGFPGTGKYTVATALLELFNGPPTQQLGPSATSSAQPWTDAPLSPPPRAELIDNHLFIDPIPVRRSHLLYRLYRREARQAAFARSVLAPQTLSTVVVCTDFQTDSEEGARAARQYCEAAERSCRPFLPVYLVCEEEERIRRGKNVMRRLAPNGQIMGKLSDGRMLSESARGRQLFVFEQEVDSDSDDDHGEHWNEDDDLEAIVGLQVDNTRVSAIEVAERIKVHVERVWPRAGA